MSVASRSPTNAIRSGEAAVGLIRRFGGEIAAAAFVIDRPNLGGAKRIADHNVKVHTLVGFEGL